MNASAEPCSGDTGAVSAIYNLESSLAQDSKSKSPINNSALSPHLSPLCGPTLFIGHNSPLCDGSAVVGDDPSYSESISPPGEPSSPEDTSGNSSGSCDEVLSMIISGLLSAPSPGHPDVFKTPSKSCPIHIIQFEGGERETDAAIDSTHNEPGGGPDTILASDTMDLLQEALVPAKAISPISPTRFDQVPSIAPPTNNSPPNEPTPHLNSGLQPSLEAKKGELRRETPGSNPLHPSQKRL